MELSLFLAGIVITHVVVWGMVRRMQSEGQHLRRYQLIGFGLMEVAFGLVLYLTGSPTLLVWLAVNAAFTYIASRLNLPPRPR
jgi:hypothetical protein